MKQRFWLYLSLGLNLAAVTFLAGKRIYFSHSFQTHKPGKQDSLVDPFEDMWNRSRWSMLSTLPIDTNSLVFVGNSLTEGFPLNNIFKSDRIVNLGIGGNECYHVLSRIVPIARQHPKVIFLEIGVNDFTHSKPLDSVFARYLRIIRIIQRESPKTMLVVQSTTPTNPQNVHIPELNLKLDQYCSKNNIRYVDIYSPLMKDGHLNSDLTIDGIHLNADGYRIWTEKIQPIVLANLPAVVHLSSL